MSCFQKGESLWAVVLLLVSLALLSLACGETITSGTIQATVAGPVLKATSAPVPTQPPEPTTAEQAPSATITESPTVPDASPTPSVVPSPTVPPATPTPSVPELEVRAGYDYLEFDYFHVVGEVVNNTDRWFEFVQIVATLYDTDNNVIGSDFTFMQLATLPPNDVGVFTLSSSAAGAAASVASYKLQVQGMPSDGPQYQDLTVTVGNEYSEYGYYHLVGEVQNIGILDCEFVRIVAGFYDPDGNLVGEDFTFAALNRVPAGGSSPFDLAAGNLAGPYDHFRVWVDGMPVR